MKLVIATKNRNKIIEIADKLSPLGNPVILSIADFGELPDIIEDGMSFEENARKKAVGISRFTGLPALADDSGLVIDALNGEPGIYSARYGGSELSDTDRNLLVLEKMKDVPDEKRTARFVCVMALALPEGDIHVSEGVCEGKILTEMRGVHGFGYDPIFFLPELGMTMAELTLDVKNTISHRARALEKTREIIESIDAIQ